MTILKKKLSQITIPKLKLYDTVAREEKEMRYYFDVYEDHLQLCSYIQDEDNKILLNFDLTEESFENMLSDSTEPLHETALFKSIKKYFIERLESSYPYRFFEFNEEYTINSSISIYYLKNDDSPLGIGTNFSFIYNNNFELSGDFIKNSFSFRDYENLTVVCHSLDHQDNVESGTLVFTRHNLDYYDHSIKEFDESNVKEILILNNKINNSLLEEDEIKELVIQKERLASQLMKKKKKKLNHFNDIEF